MRGLVPSFLKLGLIVPLFLVMFSAAPTVLAQGDDSQDTMDFSISILNCDTDPGNWSPNSMSLPEGCTPGAGITIIVSLTDGTQVGSCTTDDNGACTIEAPNGADVVVTEDESTIPAGYVPRENDLADTVATEFAGSTFINILQPADDSSEAPATEAASDSTAATDANETSTAPAGLAAGIFAGSCADDPRDVTAELTSVAVPGGSPEGSSDAIPAASSFTTVDLSLDDLLGSDYVIAVANDTGDGWIACGAIGGIRSDTGILVIGLGSVDDAGETGIAYLSPNGAQTDISVFIAGNEVINGSTPTAG